MIRSYDPIHVEVDKADELKKAILDELNNHYGIDNAISQINLLEASKLALDKNNLTTRQLRNAIKELRDAGHLICSLSGLTDTNAGYYRPVTMEEYQRYRDFHVSYAKRIFETIKAMDRSAEREFPYDIQPGLFDDVDFICQQT